eukprot:Blabericola_migrator_1__430@NODE_1102_length_5429_cov_104_416076_g755_i0_p3_GENE_NODE_1102_length_5429_cov_104_416076_g755_i0NODE_1102_length_5429_cov_104_416076_g755_i0_p3_ORF_typecomplete_len364_score67_26RNase_PH/PF01138_21/8_8e19RNase_PH_C/PF03725_15/4_9e03RNase_PH_C/PF03725_15/0_00015RdRP/PF05183_12/0_2_NODE_1102_length_5429_cov_104_416076_g755_i03591450
MNGGGIDVATVTVDEVAEKTTLSGVSAAEKKYVREGILANCRTDGRRCDQFRICQVATNVIPSAFGSARVRNSECDVVCVVKADLCGPNLSAPNEGKIAVNIQFASSVAADSQLRSTFDDVGRANQRLANTILEGPLSPKFVPRESLMIVKDRFVWKVSIDFMVLTLGGSIIDISSAALIAALRSTKLPAIKVVIENEIDAAGEDDEDDDDVASHDSTVEEEDPLTLLADTSSAADDGYFDMKLLKLTKLLSFDVDSRKEGTPFPHVDRIPIVVSIGQVEGNFVCDLTGEERLAVDTIITALVSCTGDCYGLRKEGGMPVSLNLLTTLGPAIRQTGSLLYSSLLDKIEAQPGMYSWCTDMRLV